MAPADRAGLCGIYRPAQWGALGGNLGVEMSKSTPGPWRQSDSVGFNACDIIDNKGYIVASTRFDPVGSGRTLDGMINNARLIAAAPDLLEACKLTVME